MTTFYQTPWGAQAIADVPGLVFEIPSDWVEIDQSSYQTLTANINADPAGHVAAVKLADCQARKDAYQGLTGLGLTGPAAQVLSGWKPGDC